MMSSATTAASAAPTSKDQPLLEFQLDLSKGVKKDSYPSQQQQTSKFDHLCDNIHSCFTSHMLCVNEFHKFKDELLKHSLPLNMLLQITLLSSKIHRSSSDLDALINELTRLVKQYAVPWEEKGVVLKRLKYDYENKQRQLSIAVKHLECLAVKADQMEHEKRLNNWMKLYIKVMSVKSTGRRWKFRVEPFKRKISEGYNPYGTDSEESDDSDEEEYKAGRTSLSGSDEELKELASELSQALASQQNPSTLKGMHQFAGLDETPLSPGGSVEYSTTAAVNTVDAMTWTGEPDYDHHLLVLLYRPNGVLNGTDITCSLALGDQFFVSKPYKPNDEICQSFRFSLTDELSLFLLSLTHSDSFESYQIPKLSVAVYPRSVAEDMIGHCAIPLPDLTLVEQSSVIVPPNSSYCEGQEEEEDTKPWQPNWDDQFLQLASSELEPVRYQLKLVGGTDEQYQSSPCILLVCQLVKVQKHRVYHKATGMDSLETLMKSLGYKEPCETQSRAVSALTVASSRADSPDKPQTPEVIPDDEGLSAEEMAQMALKHADELRLVQEEYERKLEALSHTLSRVKSEKQKQIKELEQALIESESNHSKRMRTSTEIKRIIAKRRKPSKGLPQWGRDWPEDFFERLSLFAQESIRRHSQLTERIRREVHDTCEQQLAAVRRLAPVMVRNPDTALQDVCLPAIFMPSPGVIYNPRAHNYFHPPGSIENRVSQPPSVLKLPPVPKPLTNINLYDISQSSCYWRQSDPSPCLTPAPPPSACDNYPPVTK